MNFVSSKSNDFLSMSNSVGGQSFIGQLSYMTYFDVANFIDINNSSDKVVADMNLFGLV